MIGFVDCIQDSIGIKGLYRDNGKENGNYFSGFRVQGVRLPMHPT